MLNDTKKTPKMNGFSLIEILAAITILGVILMVFIPFFTQFALFTNKTEQSLSGSNIADRALHDLKNSPSFQDALDQQSFRDPGDCSIPSEVTSINSAWLGIPSDSLGSYYELNEGKHYYPEITICQSPSEKNLALYRLHIKIFTYTPSGNQQLMIEIFDYTEA